jgi:hypothetical protein
MSRFSIPAVLGPKASTPRTFRRSFLAFTDPLLCRRFIARAALAGVALLAVGRAQAQLSPDFLGVVNNGNGTFTYQYNLLLQNNATIANGHQFVLYDVASLVGTPIFLPSAVTPAASFLITTPTTGPIPSGSLLLGSDTAATANASFQYNSLTSFSNNSGVSINLGRIDLLSTSPLAADASLPFAANTTSADNGTAQANQGYVRGPSVATQSNGAESGDISPDFLGVVNNGNGTFTYQYNLLLQNNTTVSPGNQVVFYDFGGLIGTPTFVDNAAVAGTFAIAVQGVGPVPPGSLVLAADTAGSNIVLSYSSGTVSNNTGATISLGRVDILSSEILAVSEFVPYAANNSANGNPTPAGNQGFVRGAAGAVSAAPEPGTFAFLAAGMLPLAGGFLRRRGR